MNYTFSQALSYCQQLYYNSGREKGGKQYLFISIGAGSCRPSFTWI